MIIHNSVEAEDPAPAVALVWFGSASQASANLGVAAAAGLALRYTAAEAQTSGVESGVNIASKSVTNAAAARLQQNSRHRASLRKARLHKANRQGKSSSSVERGFLTFGTPPFLTVMPAEAGIQSGGSGGCSPGPPLTRGRRRRTRGHRSGYFMTRVLKVTNLTESGRRGVP